MDKLMEDFEKSLFNDSKEALMDYVEVGIDCFINDGILKEIPIVETIVSVLNVGKNIHDRNLLKQTLTFISEFNNNSISKERLEKYKLKIENDTKKCEEELGRVLLLLNNFIDKEKSIMLAKLFKSYINDIIKWNEFCELSEILHRLFIQDIETLKIIKDNNITINNENAFRVERLYSIGLINTLFKEIICKDFDEGNINNIRIISTLGRMFCEIIF